MLKNFLLLSTMGVTMLTHASPQTYSIITKTEAEELPKMHQREIMPPVHGFNVNEKNLVLETSMQMPSSNLGEELPPVLNEDFSLMTTGSIESPDLSTDLTAKTYEYMWANMKEGYTHAPLWGCDFVYPAGGMVYMDASEETGGASRLTTPRVNVKDNGGVAVLSFKARTPDGLICDYLTVESAETNNWGPEWNILAAVICPEITDEWQTIEVIIQGGGPTTLFNFVAYYTPVFIDDIKITQYDLYVDIPVLNSHTNYTGNSFDISWSEVDEADSYLINVYDEQGLYLYEDKPVQSNNCTIDNIESGKTYFYTVRAVKGEHISLESYPMEIYDLASPDILDTIIIPEEQKIVTFWDDVPSAEVYNYWLYADRIATTNGEFVLTSEDFSDLTESNGDEVVRSIENPDYLTYSEYFLQTHQGGWKLRNGAPCIDYVVLDAWQYINNQGDAGLISPELDLSKDGGKISIDLSLYGDLVEGYNWDDELEMFQTQCAIALFNYDETIDDYTQAELIYIEDVKPEWNDFTVNLTKGTTRSVIGIYAVRAEGNLYVDNLKITQNYNIGEKFRDPIYVKIYHPDVEIEVTIPEIACGYDLWQKVCAVKARWGSDGLTETLNTKESEYSELKYVGIVQSGIEDLSAEQISTKVINKTLHIANTTKENVYVYSTDGTLIYNAVGTSDISIILPGNGVYIVKIGNKVSKVVC